MTYEDECREYVAKLESKAKELVGTYIREKDYESVYFVKDYYISETLVDVLLDCYYLPQIGCDYETVPKSEEIYMSEFNEYYKTFPRAKGERIWKTIRDGLDNLFLCSGKEAKE